MHTKNITRFFFALAAMSVCFAVASQLNEVDGVLVKTGSDTFEIDAAEIAGRSVRVAEGKLKINQTSITSARYIRFRIRETNPWYTQNAGSLREMQSFQLVLNENIVSYPAETSVSNLGNVQDQSTPENILVYDRIQNNDWLVRSDDPGFVIDMKENVSFNGYVIAGAIVSTGRSPYSFTVEVGVDGLNGDIEWFLFDDKTQYYTAGYGKDYFTGINGYAPRMPPVYAANPIPAFEANASVEVSSSAQLELNNVVGRIPNLKGSGLVTLHSANIELTSNCSFDGTFNGWGRISLCTENSDLSLFKFDSLAIHLENKCKERNLMVGGDGVSVLPLVYDSENAPLNLILKGKISTPKKPILHDKFGNRIPFVRHGKTLSRSADVTFLDKAPVIGRHIRFTPITGFGTLISQTQELILSLDSARIDTSDIISSIVDSSKTTNYTLKATSDQYICSTTKKKLEGVKLFDNDSSTYFQPEDGSAYGLGGNLENSPALNVYFEKIKAFDSYTIWQPTYNVANNPAYWIGMWRLESSFDGNVWELVSDQSAEKVSQNALYTSWPPVVTTPVAQGYSLRDGEWFSIDEYVVDEDFAVSGELKYLRMNITELSRGNGETNGTSFIEIAEFEVHKNQEKVEWSQGTIAYWTDKNKTPAPGIINAPVAMPNDNVNNGYVENQTADGGGDYDSAQTSQWNPGCEMFSQGAGFIIEMPKLTTFDSYKIYSGWNWDGLYRTPSKWTVDVFYDGKSWFQIDSADRENGFTPKVVWVRFQHYVTRSVDFSSVMPYASDIFNDDKPVTLNQNVIFALTNATETVCSLSGSGTVIVDEKSELTIVGEESTFAGSVKGEGTLVLDGIHFTLDKANLKSLSRIVLKNNATLSGKAEFSNDLVVEVESGSQNLLQPVSLMLIIIK
jgi:hypothetical protein